MLPIIRPSGDNCTISSDAGGFGIAVPCLSVAVKLGAKALRRGIAAKWGPERGWAAEKLLNRFTGKRDQLRDAMPSHAARTSSQRTSASQRSSLTASDGMALIAAATVRKA